MAFSLLRRTQIKSALKQRMFEQNCGESATTPKKTSQKRSAKESTTNGQNEGVAVKKIKQGRIRDTNMVA